MDSPNPTPPARSLNSVFGMKFYKVRNLIRKQWWILALTIGLGLAWKGWYLFTQPDFFESTSELSVPEEVKGMEEKRLFRMEFYEEYVGDLEPATTHLLVEPCRGTGDVGADILEPERGAGLHQADVDSVEPEQAHELEDVLVLEQPERVVGACEFHGGDSSSPTPVMA